MFYIGVDIFDFFVDIISFWSEELDIPYGNVFVFSFLMMPVFIICLYFSTTVWAYRTKNPKIKKNLPSYSIYSLCGFVALFLFFVISGFTFAMIILYSDYTLTSKDANYMWQTTYIFDFLTDTITWWSQHTPLSYAAINVLVFFVIEPFLICFLRQPPFGRH